MSHNSATVGQRVQPSCSLSGHSVSWCAHLIHFAAAPTLNSACTLKKGRVLYLISATCEILQCGASQTCTWTPVSFGILLSYACILDASLGFIWSKMQQRARGCMIARIDVLLDSAVLCHFKRQTKKNQNTHLLRHQGYCLLLNPGTWHSVSAATSNFQMLIKKSPNNMVESCLLRLITAPNFS